MKKLVPALVFSFVASVAIAQTTATPSEQAPAGDSGKLTPKKGTKPYTDPSPSTATTPSTTAKTPPATTERRAARRAKRAEKVGDKPID